ncbi:hypothetical protein BURKHO8Y_30265 [Burkholderia sp. 8Y]|nr:hypothetical protein BURKHO8Y_30265 [Burkholderia sp. 8Y]
MRQLAKKRQDVIKLCEALIDIASMPSTLAVSARTFLDAYFCQRGGDDSPYRLAFTC